MTRLALPPRRQNITLDLSFGTVTIGFHPINGRPREVFADGPRYGSSLQAILADVCVVISIALQHGIEPTALAHSLGTVPVWIDGKETTGPASVIGAILEAIIAEDL